MAHLYRSNRLETLFSLLCKILAEPLSDPLTPEIIVVPNPGMARWLTHRIAQVTGIAANLAFPLPASFIWQIFEDTLGELPDLSAFTRDVLPWRILTRLKTLAADPAMTEINQYLEDDADGMRAFQLADTIGDLFDQYLVFRPDMLLDWEKQTRPQSSSGPDSASTRHHRWQALLWRDLTRNHPRHRASLLQLFFRKSAQCTLQTDNLPERISLFGINSLAPAYLAVIDRISRHTDIHIFHLSPCRQAWDDILPERLLTIKRKSWRNEERADVSAYFTSGNPLLASMGMMGREFFSQLLQYNPEESNHYRMPQADTLLASLQADILDLEDRTGMPGPAVAPDDQSISFHNCHSRMREIQVLHDRLLDLFGADPALKPEDILVMAPDISRYAPLAAGVFGAAEGELFIPWSIADRSSDEEDMVRRAFLGLLSLRSSRCSATEIMDLLENRVIGEQFMIREEDIPALRRRVAESGVRWGLDRRQRRERGLEDSNIHTWEFGLQRLLLGHITGPMDTGLQGIIPSATPAGSSRTWLGGLAQFIRQLQSLQEKLSREHEAADWSELLLEMVDVFFTIELDEYADGIRLLRETIFDFAAHTERAHFSGPLSAAVIRSHFSRRLATSTGGQPFLTGKVTFCNMVPMRSVPFKVIWLLGMNDADYPRSQRPPDFDLMAKKPRIGDRNRRDDDRYLFLEALLSARDRFIISWTGRDQRENSDLPPSVVVAELRDYIDRSRPMEGQPTSERLTTAHPLQPFSRRCFNGNPKTASYAKIWAPTPAAEEKNIFISDPLPDTGLEEIPLSSLIRFWKHPVRYFLEQRVGLRLTITEELLPDSEPFTLDPLRGYQIKHSMLTRLLAGQDPLSACHLAEASGQLPRGEIGRRHCREMLSQAASVLERAQALGAFPAATHEFSLSLAAIRLSGALDGLHGCGRISFRPGKWTAKDLLQLWIHHLLLCLTRPRSIEPVSIHIGTDATLTLSPVQDPGPELERLAHLFLQGLNEPLHFYPEVSLALASAANPPTGMNKARRKWHSDFFPGEEEDPAYTIALRGRDPLDERFRELAEIFHPILETMETNDATA
ncbi:MAG TPA: exodeoxyribonuclease V subunit gamma [Desulfobulbaceae bacterium]|nr:exodeoxyribonuclease V subunit gamma [Desulfobulbaceae bacterium]